MAATMTSTAMKTPASIRLRAINIPLPIIDCEPLVTSLALVPGTMTQSSSPSVSPSLSPSYSSAAGAETGSRGRSSSPPISKLRILVAPSGFKESLGPDEVADCIEAGIRRVLPDPSVVDIRKVPLHDGGEGFCRALLAAMLNAKESSSAKQGVLTPEDDGVREITVTGPVGDLVASHYAVVTVANVRIGILDMAAAAGLSLVPPACRDPTVTTTYGVGQLIAAALDEGCSRIIIGCGDSGTSDGGAGMLQALGVRLLDAQGAELPRAAGGASLLNLANIDVRDLHPRLRDSAPDRVAIDAVCNIKNILCGERGVARVYGPQKGAGPTQVELLASALDNYAACAGRLCPSKYDSIGCQPGAGASGGLGAGILLLGGRLRPREDAIDEYFGVSQLFASSSSSSRSPSSSPSGRRSSSSPSPKWDLVVTAEGCLDSQSAQGKLTVEIARRARAHGAAVVALAGTIGPGADGVYDDGIAAFTSILDGPRTLSDAIASTATLLTNAAERAMRMIQMGMAMKVVDEERESGKRREEEEEERAELAGRGMAVEEARMMKGFQVGRLAKTMALGQMKLSRSWTS